MRSISLLRYPGGKGKMYDSVCDIISRNDLSRKIYTEPFSGGFGLGLRLLLNEDVQEVIINDYDRHIYAFWKAVFNYTEDLVRKIMETNITIKEWHKQKNIYINYDKHSIFDIGFSTLFLNRTNFSGILTSGPIGGYGQDSKYKLDCRFNKERIIASILAVSSHKSKVKIYNYDALELIEKLKERESQIFYNFDPPYVNKGKELYLNAYVEEDHVSLRDKVNEIKTEWIMTYDDHELIRDLYSNYNVSEFDLIYSVGRKRKERELMISNSNIKV